MRLGLAERIILLRSSALNFVCALFSETPSGFFAGRSSPITVAETSSEALELGTDGMERTREQPLRDGELKRFC